MTHSITVSDVSCRVDQAIMLKNQIIIFMSSRQFVLTNHGNSFVLYLSQWCLSELLEREVEDGCV